MRDLNRLGVTGAIDAGGGFQNYPEDYAVIEKLAADGQLTIRLAYNLFTQKPKGEKEDFLRWAGSSKYQQGDDYFRHNGAGEMLVFSAADFEDFRSRAPTCRLRWSPSSKRWCASSSRTAGRGGCTPPMTRRSAARSTCSSA
jgi:predicted amidohydrolase YtcJ